jgi:NAD(P)-dependent dehydrogenase (short-subunit alcohol dehydrogenase family)
VLVNNAGVVQGKLLLDLSPEDVRQYVSRFFYISKLSIHPHFRTFGVNALAHFWTLKAFLPEMIKNKSGHVVSCARSSLLSIFLTSRLGHCRFSRRSCRNSTDEFVIYTHETFSSLTEMAVADYNASKAAIISLHESLRYELDNRCVSCNQRQDNSNT